MIIDIFYCLIYRSTSNPVTIACELINKKIVVDAVLVGRTHNNILHGISYVTGLCVCINNFLFYSFLILNANVLYELFVKYLVCVYIINMFSHILSLIISNLKERRKRGIQQLPLR